MTTIRFAKKPELPRPSKSAVFGNCRSCCLLQETQCRYHPSRACPKGRRRRRRRRRRQRNQEERPVLLSRRSVFPFQISFLAIWFILSAIRTAMRVGGVEVVSYGDASCPCATTLEDGLDPINSKDLTPELLRGLGPDVDVETYGVGCATHDEVTTFCSAEGARCSPTEPVDCDRTWCGRSWCYVDPANCDLLHTLSDFFKNSDRYYSYATCLEMDSFTQNKRLTSLYGKVLKAGYNSNSGGWTGAYSSDGQHFQGPLDKWSGPTVNFVHEAARTAGFRIDITPPPDKLRNKSVTFYSPSMFDYCVYATALGYLDFCVAQYSVTDKRAATANWFLLGSQPLYLVVFNDGISGWDQFVQYVGTIFQPFTAGAWMFIVFFVIPVMGLLVIIHEYGKAGSAYPSSEPVMVSCVAGNRNEVRDKHVPWYHHALKSVYVNLLAVLRQAYDNSIVTYGGMLHLLGISFFILTIIAVYTANLAAILTQQKDGTSIHSMDDAIQSGYKICGERKNVDTIMKLYDFPDLFVLDPISIGGDGLPGFNCANCKSRSRVFDFMTKERPGGEEGDLYCDAAVAPLEDLEVFQNHGKHCNKTAVGEPLIFVQEGMPVSENVSPELISIFLKLKNDGVYEKEVIVARPQSHCPIPDQGEGSALNIAQLTGIWIVTFGFAFLGLIVTFVYPRIKAHRKKRLARNEEESTRTMKLKRRNQFGESKRVLTRLDSFDNLRMPSQRASPFFSRSGTFYQPSQRFSVRGNTTDTSRSSKSGDTHPGDDKLSTRNLDNDIQGNGETSDEVYRGNGLTPREEMAIMRAASSLNMNMDITSIEEEAQDLEDMEKTV